MDLTGIRLTNDAGDELVGESLHTLESSTGDPIYLFRRVVVTPVWPNANLTLTASAAGTVLVGVRQESDGDDSDAQEDGAEDGEGWPTTTLLVSASEVGRPVTAYGIFHFPFDSGVEQCWFDVRIAVS
ncbi:hypothetical protein [Nocardia sp. NBC_01327]|uniref:hypothetical protein n=1 Tax=Nocardia sp. NBC_01327 TaxID=2903593 RepID=UPI002E13C80F|nr:hypothetical protein OG326_29530 [Nocardia sp. NBC_01327]